jgi:hypothetical protein
VNNRVLLPATVRSADAAGFVLLELIVAFTIMALGFSVLFAGMSQSARNIEKLERVQDRIMSARSLLTELDLVRQLKAGDVAQGNFPDGTRWRIEIHPYIAAAGGSLGLLRVELRLEWDGVSGIRSRTIETYRLIRSSIPVVVSLQDQFREIQ